MAKKEAKEKAEEHNGFKDMKKQLMGMVSDFFLGSIKESLKEASDEFVNKLRKALIDFGKITIQFLLIGIIMFIGFVYLIFSFVLITRDYFNISIGISLMIWAFILIAFGLLYTLFLSSKKKDEK